MEADQATANTVRSSTAPELSEPNAPLKPVIIMLSGLPGTGKSFLSHKLAERLTFTIVESDAVRKELFAQPSYSPEESAAVFHTVHRRIEELLNNGRSVIFDATNLEEKHRKTVYQITRDTGARLIFLEVTAPLEIVKNRLKDRRLKHSRGDNSDANWEIYRKMCKTADKITLPHFTVNTGREISPMIEKIVKEATC
jgi:predicted kinase